MNRLRDVRRLDALRARQVGDGAGELEDAIAKGGRGRSGSSAAHWHLRASASVAMPSNWREFSSN